MDITKGYCNRKLLKALDSSHKQPIVDSLGNKFTLRRSTLLKRIFFLLLMLFSFNAMAGTTSNQAPETIPNSELHDFNLNPTKVKTLINLALNLADKNLTYHYGSANPATGGMDCSGTIYYLLNSMGITDVPRSSNLIYLWVEEKGHFYAVNSNQLDSLEFSHLRPGDLLFWNGTYAINRNPNVTHVMLYIGKDKAGHPLVVGSSDGRSYKGRRIDGVSVFDLQLPETGGKSRFLGYSCTPGINCAKSIKNTLPNGQNV